MRLCVVSFPPRENGVGVVGVWIMILSHSLGKVVDVGSGDAMLKREL